MLWLLVALFVGGHSKVSEGRFDAQETQWEFIDKFCFDPSGGTVTFNFVNDGTNPSGQQVLFYSDVASAFPAIYATDNSCGFKRNASNRYVMLYTDNTPPPNGYTYPVIGARPRWWYLVFSNCEGNEERIGLTYKVTYTNAGGRFSYHFSADEQGIFEALIFAIVILTFLIILYAVTLHQFRKQIKTMNNANGNNGRSYYYLHMIMLVVVCVKWLVTCLRLAHADTFSRDGIGHPSYEKPALFFDMIPDIILTTLLIFISKGWTISVHRVQEDAIRAVLETLVLYTVAVVVCYAWSFQDFDPVLFQSIYQTDPGIIVVILRILLLIWFASNLHVTWRDERNLTRKRFYIGFFLYGFVYYLFLPVTLIMATRIDSWMQKKVVHVTEILIQLLAYTVMWILFGLCGRQYRARTSDDDDAPTLQGKRSSEDIALEDIPKLSAPKPLGMAAEDSDNERRNNRKRKSEDGEDEGEEEGEY